MIVRAVFFATLLLSLIFSMGFSLTAAASQAKLSTLDNELEEQNTIDVSLAQKKTERRGIWEGDVSVGKTTTFATDDSPTTVTLDLGESVDYHTLRDWTFALDGKQDHENDGLNVIETGLSAQKKIYYTRPSKKKTKSGDDDGDEPFYPSLAMKLRLASGSTSESTGLAKKSKNGVTLPKLIGFQEHNEGLTLTWDFLENWSAGISFTQYQYIGFNTAQAFLYAHPGVAQRLSGATSSVSSVVDHEEVANIQWFFTDDWDVNLIETLQTDYVTGDLGSSTELDVTWAFRDHWSATLTATYEHITPSLGDPSAGLEPIPAQDVFGGGAAVAFLW